MAEIPTYEGTFGHAEAERLLWRAGFGPRRGQAATLANLGLNGAVRSLTHPPGERWVGPRPRDEKGRPLAPADAWGHDHLWWLDRMVRTSRPLVERMTLVWHDWFATSNAGVGSQKLMLAQNRLLRRYALGSFDRLLVSITANPAMLIWLSGTDNRKDAPNENYGRELMELFTLGEGNGYTERDVREQARALTGWTSTWKRGKGQTDFRFDSKRHDTGVKTVFGKKGTYAWRDSASLCVHHPKHAPFFVQKLWSYFIPEPPDPRTRAGLEALYREGFEVRPVLDAILRHPALYTGPRMVKPPVVYIAGLLRGLNRGVDTTAWVWLSDGAGQRLFNPPNVAGWDDSRWLDTNAFRGRWYIANTALEKVSLGDKKGKKGPKIPNDPEAIVKGALAVLGNPTIRPETRRELLTFARGSLQGTTGWKAESYPPLVANAVRQLLAVSPDLQTC
ncbi:DUF1800 domain-containing protein [Gaiella sp.]|uniref:DUF1800 domain-containing protein n=1 Tax=Gaiella sp. TaxID=2663207 RepID=UPI003264DBA8